MEITSHKGFKRKTIRMVLDKHIEEWRETIKDEDVKKLAAKNTIVTGGSIASMLLGEKINDYDIYFRDVATTEAVANYYVNKFMKDNPTRLGRVASDAKAMYVSRDMKENIRGETEDRVQIFIKSAGIASETDERYEYFEMAPEDSLYDYVENITTEAVSEEGQEKFRPVFLSQNAITLSDKMQIVIRFYGEPDQIHSNYDFVHAMNYYDYGKRELVLKQEALEALLSRTLVYRGSLYPVASIFRVKKFVERGWKVTAGELLKIMWQISEIDLSDHKIMEEQLQGVDQAYMWQLQNALRDVNKDQINSTYVAAIIDKIFG